MSRIIDKNAGPPYIEYLFIMVLSFLTFRRLSWVEMRRAYVKEELSKHHKQV
ncbi:hypothetical protein JOC85_003060 [Bacillus mesophilus]|nr:hypothetical protein [Bacillus mesophilus]